MTPISRLRLPLIALLLLAAIIAPATARGPDEIGSLIGELAAGSYAKTAKAVEALAATGDERVVPALRALLEGDLYTVQDSGRVVIARRSGRTYVLADPLGGGEIGEAKKQDLEKIRVNNRLRSAIRGALGGLNLMNHDTGRRLAAADEVFRTRSPETIEVLETAIAREENDHVRARMERALAAARLGAGDPATRIGAIETLSRYPEPEVRGLLSATVAAEADEGVRTAAAEALADVEQRLALWSAFGNLFHGISLGSVLLLAAVGLAITFGVMGVINLAHGELVMLGAYTTFVVQEVFRAHLPGAFDYSLFVAIPTAFVVAGAVGIGIERGIIRWLYGRPLETLLATWGLSLILQQLVRTLFGPTNQAVGNPSWMSGAIVTSQGLVFTYNRIWIIVFSLLVLGLLALLLKRTGFGLEMRAVTQNRRMAASMGIRTGRVDALTFGLGSGIAGIAGVALSQIDNVSPNLGQSYIIDSFMVVVFGGVGNIWGTLVGAYTLGLVNKLLEPFAGAVLAKILVLVAIILFIQKRPRGLFALKGRAVEA